MTSLLRCVAQVDFISKSYHVSIYQLYYKILICTSFGSVVYAKWKKHVQFFDMFDFSTCWIYKKCVSWSIFMLLVYNYLGLIVNQILTLILLLGKLLSNTVLHLIDNKLLHMWDLVSQTRWHHLRRLEIP